MGIINIVKNNLTNCSIIFDNIWGNIFSFPKKYPLIKLDKHINGNVSPIHIIGKYVSLFFNRVLDIIGAIKNIIKISIVLYMRVNGIIGAIIVFDFLFFSLTSFDIEMVNDIVHSVIKRLKVGKTKLYNPIPLVPILLVNAILIIMANILVIKPPITKIIVDFIKLFFIIFTI